MQVADENEKHNSWQLVFPDPKSAAQVMRDNTTHLKCPIGKWDTEDNKRNVVFRFNKSIPITKIQKWLHIDPEEEDNKIMILKPKYVPRPHPDHINTLRKELLNPIPKDAAGEGTIFVGESLTQTKEAITGSVSSSKVISSQKHHSQQFSTDLNDSSNSLSISFLSQLASEDEDILLTWLKELQTGRTMEYLEQEVFKTGKHISLFLRSKKTLSDYFTELNRRKYYEEIFFPICKARIEKNEISLSALLDECLKEGDLNRFNFLFQCRTKLLSE